ncbi:MAG TPA: endo-1,4-beta-xylanase [Terracidiphilus sp.]|nr:endo-1,4-beta-xylanase [Terracidiphilus sp.]
MITRREYLKQTTLAGCGLALAHALPAQPASNPNAHIEGRDSFKARAHKRGLLAGCAVSATNLHEDAFTKVLAEQYSLVVPENCMKFAFVHPAPDHYSFDDADALVVFAQHHKMKVRGHNFVWHEALPSWFAGTVTKENAKKILTEHIITVAGRYKGKMHSWDVVNEAINIGDGRPDSLRKSPWLELIGPEYLELAYRTARQADPKAKLTYNEYGIENESDGNASKRAATLALLKRLKAANVPLDALGIQSHISAGSGQTFGKGLRELIDGAQSLGLEVYFTELDVNDDAIQDNDAAARDRMVADVYRDYLAIALESKAVKAVLTWGLTDAHTWLNGIKSHKEKQPNRPQRPLPFDADYKPTPAFFAMRDAFDKASHR